MNLTVRILIGMAAGLVLGVAIKQIGFASDGVFMMHVVGGLLTAGGDIFVNSLRLMVVPLVFVSLVCGASALSDGPSMGRLGGKTLGLYLVTTAIAVTLALSVALIISPGEGTNITVPDGFESREAPSFWQTLVDIVPTNPIAAMAEGKMLQVIVFALLLGITLTRTGERGARIKGFFEDLNEVMMGLISILIKLAPYGVFCLMTTLFARLDLGDILKLVSYFMSVVIALVLHATLVYPTLLWVLGRLNPVVFFKKMREPMIVAFSTASSGATLPVTLRTVEHRVGVKNEVASFAIPLGATINMDGTAIMQGVATVFIAQFYNIDLTVMDYVTVVLTATMASVGTAAVPGVGLITLAMVLTQVGLPVEGIALIIGVDRLLDMLRTAVNVSGDGTVAAIVARSENMFDKAIFDDPNAGAVFDVKEHGAN